MPSAPPESPPLISVTDFHRATGMRQAAIRAAFFRGEIDGVQLARKRKIYIRADEIERILGETDK